MISINGLNNFRNFFKDNENNYVIIGGTACAIIFDEIGENFRATKDLDVVLLVENLNKDFENKLWNFIKEAGYTVETSNNKKNFYRFKNPKSVDYPKMTELFSRRDDISIITDAHIVPVHISDEISSLSAILLNDDYYKFMNNGKRVIDGLTVLDEKHLIPFKAKAWCELIERRKNGEEGQSKHIKKHCRDIANLVTLLSSNTKVELFGQVKVDMQEFINNLLLSEFVPDDINIEELYNRLKNIYL